MPSGRNSYKRKEPLLKRKSKRLADVMIPIRMLSWIVVGLPVCRQPAVRDGQLRVVV